MFSNRVKLTHHHRCVLITQTGRSGYTHAHRPPTVHMSTWPGSSLRAVLVCALMYTCAVVVYNHFLHTPAPSVLTVDTKYVYRILNSSPRALRCTPLHMVVNGFSVCVLASCVCKNVHMFDVV